MNEPNAIKAWRMAQKCNEMAFDNFRALAFAFAENEDLDRENANLAHAIGRSNALLNQALDALSLISAATFIAGGIGAILTWAGVLAILP